MKGNFHVRFLGGLGLATAPGYPVHSTTMNKLYQRRKQFSAYWFNKSSDLRGAAAAVWVGMDADVSKIVVDRAELGSGFSMGAAVGPVYEMLCGMALELIFKAITVERGERVNESTHDLLEHLKPTGIAYTPQQIQLLRIFSHSITWAGRYPVPKREGALDEFQELARTNLFERVPLGSSGSSMVLRANGALNWDSFSELWGKACSLYFQVRDAEPGAAPDGGSATPLGNSGATEGPPSVI